MEEQHAITDSNVNTGSQRSPEKELAEKIIRTLTPLNQLVGIRTVALLPDGEVIESTPES